MQNKLLFVQFRTDVSERHEQECVRDVLRLSDDRLVFLNAVTDSFPSFDATAPAGIILGGSGEFFLGQDHGIGSWRDRTFVAIDRILAKHIPLLGICFGFQFFALHQGGRIVRDPHLAEVGSFEITTLPSAAEDPLFSEAPDRYMGQLGHKETMVDLPEHLVPLARSERVECQAFRIAGKRAWGVLFHLELTKERMKERLDLFPNYAASPTEVARIKDAFQETPEANDILRRFVEMALL